MSGDHLMGTLRYSGRPPGRESREIHREANGGPMEAQITWDWDHALELDVTGWKIRQGDRSGKLQDSNGNTVGWWRLDG